ncbi:MAG: ABC transporter ATP-binding protein [Candidatus Moranbacteria bacterium]|nr:ABC transporter ATP-binding protein [Candidatus Moranbacteria bacterium]
MEEEQKNEIPNITVKDVNVIYNEGKSNEMRALEEIDLEILPQEYVIIFGPSGCGKSTLLYSIAGLQKPTSGVVMIDGEDISAYKKKQMALFHRRKMGMVFQAFYLIGSLSILDNVCLPKAFDGVKIAERKAKALELLERFNISNQADKFPSELSGGQKQRVSIARALVNDPEIILADEPVGNLDSKSAHIVMSILKDLNEIDKKTVILVTHDPAHLQFGDKIVHMRDGKIIKIEIIKRKKTSAESYIFKDGKIQENLQGELVKEEYIPLDLRHLMRSFRGLTANQISNLLVPFKAQQIFSHLFFSMTNDQIEKAIKKVEDFLYARNELDDFRLELDAPLEKGGAGWDKRIAERFALEVNELTEQAKKISFTEKIQSAEELVEYINIKMKLNLDDTKKGLLSGAIVDRLENSIGKDEFEKLMDISEKKSGLGFDKRVASKIARELELLLLLRYSS